MGWFVRKSFSLSKLLRLNVSKNGMSVSVGRKGASMTFGEKGTYINTGLPGTGIRYREKISGASSSSKAHSDEAIKRALSVLDEYDRKKEEEAAKRRGSDEVPEMKVKDIDPLFWDAAYYVVNEPLVTTGRIKLHFDISYTRVSEITEQLEANGIITPYEHGRKVLVTKKAIDEMKRKYEQGKSQ